MLLTAAAAAGLIYFATNNESSPAVVTPPSTPAESRAAARRGDLATQQNNWTTAPYVPANSGKGPLQRRLAVPDLQARTVMGAAEDTSLRLSDQYKEYMRKKIEDTEFDEVPFRGERASDWAGRSRRTVPIINHPNSEISYVGIPPVAAQTDPLPVPQQLSSAYKNPNFYRLGRTH